MNPQDYKPKLFGSCKPNDYLGYRWFDDPADAIEHTEEEYEALYKRLYDLFSKEICEYDLTRFYVWDVKEGKFKHETVYRYFVKKRENCTSYGICTAALQLAVTFLMPIAYVPLFVNGVSDPRRDEQFQLYEMELVKWRLETGY